MGVTMKFENDTIEEIALKETSCRIDDKTIRLQESPKKPGAELAAIRLKHGFTREYVASKLHLRVILIEHLEEDNYDALPEVVFVQGYIRAYAKILNVKPEPILKMFYQNYAPKEIDHKNLWQPKRETNKLENVLRIVTGLFALGVVVAVSIWWQMNKENEKVFAENTVPVNTSSSANLQTQDTDIYLTDLSKMKSLLEQKSE
jgi:cytoskeleton protein RodZ